MAHEETTPEPSGGGVTIGHLLMLIGLLGPAEVVIGDVHYAGGGILRYAIGIPVALAAGSLIVWLLWSSGRALYLRSIGYSERVQSVIAIGVYIFYLVGVIAGMILGTKIASLLVKHVA